MPRSADPQSDNRPYRSLEADSRDEQAVDALELARMMPPGEKRIEALKKASLLRCAADKRGVTFAKRGRPAG